MSVCERACVFQYRSCGAALHAKKHHIHATTTGSAPLHRRTLAKTIRNNHILINIRRGVCMSVKIIIRIIIISIVLLLPSNGGEYIYIYLILCITGTHRRCVGTILPSRT